MSAIFLALLLGTSALDIARPAELPQLIGAEAHEFERSRNEANFLDGSLAAHVTYLQRLRSRTRQVLGPLWAACSLRYLKSAPQLLVVGPNDWLFLRYRRGDPWWSTADLVEGSALLVAAFERRLAAHGVDVYAVPVPRKVLLARSELPRGFDPRPEIEPAMHAALQRRGVRTVDLEPALAALPVERRYWKYDTHWSHEARKVAAEVLVAEAGLLAAQPRTELIPQEGEQKVASLQAAGITPGTRVAGTFAIPTETRFALDVAAAAEHGIDVQGAKMRRLALAGTSFSGLLADALAHYADESVWNGFLAGRGFMGTLVDFLAQTAEQGLPDVLWYEFPLHQGFMIGAPARGALGETQREIFTRLPDVPTCTLDVSLQAPTDTTPLLLPAGKLLTDGAPLAYLRIRPSPDGAQAPGGRWRIATEDLQYDLDWPAERASLLAPILALRTPGTWVRVNPVDEPAQALLPELAFAVVTDLDLERGIEGVVSHHYRTEAGFVHAAAFDAIAIERHDGLHLQLMGVPEEREVRVTAHTTDGRSASWTLPLTLDAHALLGLGALAGSRLERVELVDPTDAVPSRVQRAVFARQARAAP